MKTIMGMVTIGLISFGLSLNGMNFLLSSPERFLQQEERTFATCFTWGNLGKTMCELTFAYEHEESSLRLAIHESLANKLPASELAMFERKEIALQGLKNVVFVFQKGDIVDTFCPLTISQQAHDEYHLAHPLRYSNVVPKRMDRESLLQIITTKNIVFYTGAGISAAANICTMNKLENRLQIGGLREGKNQKTVISAIVNNPELSLKRFSKFCKTMYLSKPTKAHRALAAIAELKAAQILTENEDLLHEGTGIKPIRINAIKFKGEVEPEWLENIDYIVCIGLSRDDKGFLSWYLDHNPHGNIIAIDFAQPDYLSGIGFWVKGDVQEILPRLHRAFSAYA